MKKNYVIFGIVGASILLIGLLFSLVKINNVSSPTTANAPRNDLQAIYNKIPTSAGKTNFLKQSNNLTETVDPELVDLDSQIITCDPNVDGVMSQNPNFGSSCVSGNGSTLSSIKGLYMGGQCCSALMNTDDRHVNLKKLQAYKSMPDIPLDPMHTPVAMAKKWIDYDNNTTLTPDQQKVMDQAMATSKEKPCCCKCWHYYTNEGIAKKMIQDGTYNSQQIADFWDASDICGA